MVDILNLLYMAIASSFQHVKLKRKPYFSYSILQNPCMDTVDIIYIRSQVHYILVAISRCVISSGDFV